MNKASSVLGDLIQVMVAPATKACQGDFSPLNKRGQKIFKCPEKMQALKASHIS